MHRAKPPVVGEVDGAGYSPTEATRRTYRARPSLSRQVGWTLLGNLAYAAAQSITIIILAKTLTPAMVGQFGLGVAITTPVLMFTNLQLRSLQATEALSRARFDDYLALRWVSTLAAVIVIIGIILVVRYSTVTGLVILCVGTMKCVEALSDTIYGQLQRFERMDRIAISMICKGALSIVALSSVIALTKNVAWGALAVAGAFAAVLVVYDLPAVRHVAVGPSVGPEECLEIGATSKTSARLSVFRALIRLGLPLGITSVLLAIAANIPRYLLERTGGEASLGYFVALAYPSALFAILLSAFGQAATPRMAEFHRVDRPKFRKLVLRIAMVPLLSLVLIGGIALLLGPNSLRMLYRTDYAQYFREFLLLLVAGAVWGLASVLGYAATSSRRLVSQAPAAVLICVVTTLCSLFVVPRYGIAGAAVASMIAGITGVVVYGILLLGKADASDLDDLVMKSPIRGASATKS